MTGIRKELKINLLAIAIIVICSVSFVISALAEEPVAEGDYPSGLQTVIEQVEKNVEIVDQELDKQGIEERNRQREAEAKNYFEKGKVLYKEGKLKEAKQAWQKALEISEDLELPELKSCIADSAEEIKEQERIHEQGYVEEAGVVVEQQQEEYQATDSEEVIRAEQREKERLERKKEPLEKERLRQAKLSRKKEEQRQKKEQKALEAERKKIELAKKQTLKKEINFYYWKARSYYKAKNYDIAIQEFNRVLELDPGHKSSQRYLNSKIPARIKTQKKAEEARLAKEKREKEKAEKIRQRELEKQQQSEQREKERLERERQKQLEAEQRKKEPLEKERLRQAKLSRKKEEQKQKREWEELEREKMKKSQKVIRETRKTAEEIKEELKPILNNLSYKTVKECLDASTKDPENKKIFENLVELYLLIDKYLEKAKDLYNKGNWGGAINECQKVLIIDPDNKGAVSLVRKSEIKIERLKNNK